MSKWIREGDEVLVIAGNDKGKRGKVLARKGAKILVEGANIRKKHLKKSEESPNGQIAEIERPFNISNVALCDEQGNRLKLRVRMADGKKELVTRNGEVHRAC